MSSHLISCLNVSSCNQTMGVIAMHISSLTLHVRQHEVALLQVSWLSMQGRVVTIPLTGGADDVDAALIDLLSAAKFTLGPAGPLGS